MSQLTKVIDFLNNVIKYYSKANNNEEKLSAEILKKRKKRLADNFRELSEEQKVPPQLLLTTIYKFIKKAHFTDLVNKVLEEEKSISGILEHLDNIEPCEQKATAAGLPEDLVEAYPAASNSKLGFNHGWYLSVLTLVELLRTFESQGNKKVQAFNLSILFIKPEDIFQYLQSFQKVHSQSVNVLFEACSISLPADTPAWNLNIWRQMAKEHMASNNKFQESLIWAGKIEEKLPSFSISSTVDDIYTFACTMIYTRAHENSEAARVFHEAKISESNFNRYLDDVLPNIKDSERIPNIRIASDCGKYYLVKLDPFNPIAAVLGNKTNCCQLMGGQGEACAIHGMTSVEGGFYVVYEGKLQNNKKNDAILSQSWAWRSTSQAMVLDSIESSINVNNNPEKQKAIRELYIKLSERLVTRTDYGIPSVMVGTAGDTPADVGLNGVGCFFKSETPIDYLGYRDSHSQRLVHSQELHLATTKSKELLTTTPSEPFKHWVQSCLNSVTPYSEELNEIKDEDLLKVVGNARHIHQEVQKAASDINLDDLIRLSQEGYCVDLHNYEGDSLLLKLLQAKEYQKAKTVFNLNQEYSRSLFKLQMSKSKINWIYMLPETGLALMLELKLVDFSLFEKIGIDFHYKVVSAAKSKQWAAVRTFIDNGMSIESPKMYYGNDTSILGVAVDQESPDEITWLLDKGAQVNEQVLDIAKGKKRWDIFDRLVMSFHSIINAALRISAENEQWHLVLKYLKLGAKSYEEPYVCSALNILAEHRQWDLLILCINKKAYEGNTVLDDALYFTLLQGEWDVVRWLILQGADSDIALLYAAEKGEWALVKEFILIYEADINATHNDLNRYIKINNSIFPTALMKASAQENLSMISWLIDHGADLSFVHHTDLTCCSTTYIYNKWSSFKFLLEHYRDQLQDDLIWIINREILSQSNNTKDKLEEKDEEPSFWRLLNFLANPNAVDSFYGKTILTALCSQRNLRWNLIEELIIEYGADINATDNSGDTPLLSLCTNHTTTLNDVKRMHSLGANLYARNKKGENSVRVFLTYSSNIDVAFWLIEQNVDTINSSHKSNMVGTPDTIFLLASYYGKFETAKNLVARGADAKHVSPSGYTALMLHVNGIYSLEMMRWLVTAQGINLNASTSDGQTAIYMAAYRSKWPIVRNLLEIGADCNVSVRKEVNNHSFFAKSSKPSFRTETVLGLTVYAATSDPSLWPLVADIIKKMPINLSESEIHAEPLKMITDSAPFDIKDLLQERTLTEERRVSLDIL